jgi:CRP-like cAMP-binding protein
VGLDAALGARLHELPGILATLDAAEFDQLCGYLEAATLSEDEALWPSTVNAEERRSLAFIVEGSVEVMKETDFPGKHVVLAVLHPGAVVGEVCSFGDNCHALTAVAVTAATLAVLSLDNLDLLCEKNPQLGVKIMKGLLGVAARRLDKSYQRLTSVF